MGISTQRTASLDEFTEAGPAEPGFEEMSGPRRPIMVPARPWSTLAV